MKYRVEEYREIESGEDSEWKREINRMGEG